MRQLPARHACRTCPAGAYALLLLAISAGGALHALEVPTLPDQVGQLPVLHQGRIKPLAVASEEIVYAVTGKGHFAIPSASGSGANAHQEMSGPVIHPTALVVSWMTASASWQDQPFLYAPFLPLQRELSLAGEWASPQQVAAASGYLSAAFSKHNRADTTKERVAMTPLETAAYTLAERTEEANEVFAGDSLGLMPLAPDASGRAWLLTQVAPLLPEPAADNEVLWRGALRRVLARSAADREAALTQADIWLSAGDVAAHDPLLQTPGDAGLSGTLVQAQRYLALLGAHDAAGILQAQPALVRSLRSQGERASLTSHHYPSSRKLAAELVYQQVHPFTWVWLCYILGSTLVAVALSRRTAPVALAAPAPGTTSAPSWMLRIGVVITLLGVGFNLYGLGTRVYITSLGAVTNLYETLVYVALLCAVLGLVFARATGVGLYAAAGGVAGALCAAVGEALPPDLGSHIGQLQPVLRSNFWLWTHVKTEVASYAAFMLAWAVGNGALLRALLTRTQVTREEGQAVYRCLQVGVVLVSAGTLLGAMWADKAWGRFWGWDPKEDWALIVLLTYLVPLHLRYVGIVGATGLAAWAVFGFMSVVMSWYGVNFILGTGLHAYAFGQGGQAIVLPLCALQIVMTTLILLRLRSRRSRGPAGALAAAPAP
jgi:ABC-type transport system involved in cytochrome c biogenesis permease subunit